MGCDDQGIASELIQAPGLRLVQPRLPPPL